MKDIVNRIFEGLRLIFRFIFLFLIPLFIVVFVMGYSVLGVLELLTHFMQDNDRTLNWFSFYNGTNYIPVVIVIFWFFWFLFIAYVVGGNSSENEITHENTEQSSR